METVCEYNLQIPSWSLSALFNRDYSGLEDEDIELLKNFENKYNKIAEENGAHYFVLSVDTWLEEYEYALENFLEWLDIPFDAEDNMSTAFWKEFFNLQYLKKKKDDWKDPYFSHYPEFGLACAVYDVTLLILK